MLLLVREDGKNKISWWWDSNSNKYFRRVNGERVPLSNSEFLEEVICKFPNSQHCDGVEKWIEAGRPN